MIQLFQAVSGEIEYVGFNPDELEQYLNETYPERTNHDDYVVGYKFRAWQLNKRLKEGKILVGVDGDSFLFAKPENILKGIK